MVGECSLKTSGEDKDVEEKERRKGMQKLKMLRILISILLITLIGVIGCSEENLIGPDESRIPPDVTTVTSFEKEGPTSSVKWNSGQHHTFTQLAYKALGVNVGGYYHYSDDPDLSTDPDDIGYNGFAGGLAKPGHAYFWDKDNGSWNHTEPYEWLWGNQHWADYNFNKWANYIRDKVNANNKTEAQKKIAYLMHYVEDLGCIYHSYWPTFGTWYQICSHLPFENSVEDNWNSGKVFSKEVFPAKISNEMTDASSFEDAAVKTSREIAQSCYRIVDITGITGSPNWNNSEVYNATTLSLRKTTGYVMGMLVRIAKHTGIHSDDGSGEYYMSSNGTLKYFWLYASKNDKIYCAANWYQKTSGDIDVYLWSNNEGKYVAHSTSGSDNPEDLQYVVPSTGWYAVCAYAYSGVSGSTVCLNSIAIKKKSFGYLYD